MTSTSAQREFTGRRRRRIILAASAGNFAEWYDWGVYGVVATLLATQFFPSGDAVTGLLNTYAVFALGYLARPLGGIVFGRIGDKHGRRRAMSLTVLVTCGGTAAMGLLPTYQQIGLFAPLLLVLCRMAQSMGAGGEYASAISFVYEHSPARRRARNVAQLVASTFVGIMTGSVLARITSAVMSRESYEAYGWRILFLVTVPLALMGVYLRRRVEETPEFEELARTRRKTAVEAAPLRSTLRQQWPAMLVLLVCTASYALISTTITSYLTTFLIDVGGLATDQAYNATVLSNLAVIAATLATGVLCDRVGLRRTLTIAGCVVAALAVPSLALAASGLAGGLVGVVLIGTCKGLLALPALLALSAIFPVTVRVTAGALAYNVTQAAFGGTGPIIGVWLNDSTGGPYGLGIYLTVLAVSTVAGSIAGHRIFDRRFAEAALPGPAEGPATTDAQADQKEQHI
ncbi:MFS transporter [Streptomyces samsunensis]|uniref:MFS transporter n=1 Tax=Streptomyces malaysiensis TaxID=92644 RepID=UPI0015842A2B|nr:MFS transporter [Streptomyces samsunensis]NUH39791.1 MFS transporter [Streptomyces samsunensis]